MTILQRQEISSPLTLKKGQNLQELITLRNSLKETRRKRPLPWSLPWNIVRSSDAPKCVLVRVLNRKGTVFFGIWVPQVVLEIHYDTIVPPRAHVHGLR